MNLLTRILWRWQGRRKLNHRDIGYRYTAIRKLGEVASVGDLEILLDLLGDQSQVVRNASSQALRSILDQVPDEQKATLEQGIIERFDASASLIEKLAIIEVMRSFTLARREQILGSLVKESENDLQYSILYALEGTQDYQILDDILDASNTSDLVLRRIALQTWYDGVSTRDKEGLDYCTPRLHFLIRASYELQTNGEFLRTILSYADRNELPHPKAYPDFIIRYVTELLGKWDYDPDAYRSLHAIMVPSYFTFDETAGDQERPYVIL